MNPLRFKKIALLPQSLKRATAVAVRGPMDQTRFMELGLPPEKITVAEAPVRTVTAQAIAV